MVGFGTSCSGDEKGGTPLVVATLQTLCE